uniref:Uncharacterized protein n=1 Tax=Arundo donax TaxID=35708 RepID=A0A0A9H0Z9_ARUDO
MGKQRQHLCMVFLMAFLVVSAMHAVTVEAGRVLTQVGYGALNPGRTPSVARGEPYAGRGRGCTNVYECNKPPAGAP